MAENTHTTMTTDAETGVTVWNAAMKEWHAAELNLAEAEASAVSDEEESDRIMYEATTREDAAARMIFATPAPHQPALLHKFAVFRALYASTGNCSPPVDHHDLVALASIEADVVTLALSRAGGR